MLSPFKIDDFEKAGQPRTSSGADAGIHNHHPYFEELRTLRFGVSAK
jgi:hypothetical protein